MIKNRNVSLFNELGINNFLSQLALKFYNSMNKMSLIILKIK